MPAKRIVDAVSVGADQVICPCGKVIELEPEDPELLEVGNMVYLPRLVAIDCPRCRAEVRLDRFLEDFHSAGALISAKALFNSDRKSRGQHRCCTITQLFVV